MRLRPRFSLKLLGILTAVFAGVFAILSYRIRQIQEIQRIQAEFGIGNRKGNRFGSRKGNRSVGQVKGHHVKMGKLQERSLLVSLGGILQVLKMENNELIRKLVLIDGLSQNAVAKRLGHSKRSSDGALG